MRATSPAGVVSPTARWWMLGLLSTAEVLGMSVWFSASAVAGRLQELWGLTAGEVSWLTGSVQLGFVAGTAAAALLNLADVVPARAYMSACACAAAAANAALVLAPGYGTAVLLRFAAGAFLAGVYPPAMKMAATWFRSGRGLAIGTIVGALTVGKASPWVVRALERTDVNEVVLVTSAAAALAGLAIAVLYRDGPFPFERRPFSWKLTAVIVRHRQTRLATLGYLGHMWELYAMWTWVPAFVAASLAARAYPSSAGTAADWVAFLAIAAGGAGCVWGGWQADRIGRERVVNLSMAISGACSLAIGLLFGASPVWLATLALVWGFFVVADSAQFSTLVTEVAPRHAVGTALTLQTSLGFLLTIVTIRLVPELVDAVGWRWAFAALAPGPALGIAAIRRLAAIRRAG